MRNKSLEASGAERLNKVPVRETLVLFHDVGTSPSARPSSSQSHPLPANYFTHGNLLSDGCNEPINEGSIFRNAPNDLTRIYVYIRNIVFAFASRLSPCESYSRGLDPTFDRSILQSSSQTQFAVASVCERLQDIYKRMNLRTRERIELSLRERSIEKVHLALRLLKLVIDARCRRIRRHGRIR